MLTVLLIALPIALKTTSSDPFSYITKKKKKTNLLISTNNTTLWTPLRYHKYYYNIHDTAQICNFTFNKIPEKEPWRRWCSYALYPYWWYESRSQQSESQPWASPLAHTCPSETTQTHTESEGTRVHTNHWFESGCFLIILSEIDLMLTLCDCSG